MDEPVIRQAEMLHVTLNGKLRSIETGTTVSGLLEQLELQDRLVVVERNGAILRRPDFGTTALLSGDVLEIVHFVGGG